MKITVTFRHLEATDAIKEHVKEKLEKFKKYLIRPIDVHVILSVEKIRQQCEIVMNARDFHAQSLDTDQDLYAAIDKAIHKLESQIRKHKEKIKDHKHQMPVHTTAAIAEAQYEQAEE